MNGNETENLVSRWEKLMDSLRASGDTSIVTGYVMGLLRVAPEKTSRNRSRPW